MSVRQVQIQNVLDTVAQAYFIDGQSPLLDDIFKYLSRFFADQPAGSPYRVSLESVTSLQRSDIDALNDLMATLVANIDTLYEVCFNHIDQILVLNSVLRSHLERLRIKRTLLTNKIDDYLLGIYDSDGYFYSFSDDFVDTTNIDFDLTSAFVDTQAGVLSIPALSSKSRIISADAVSVSSITATDITGKVQTVNEKTDLSDALDGLSNTAWYMEIKTNDPAPIVMDIELLLSNQLSENLISKIDITPFGVEPIQCGINATHHNEEGTVPLSHKVQTSGDKMVFIVDQANENLRSIKFQLKKNRPDYKINDAYEKTNVYVFGFKDIIISEQYFDQDARFVSTSIPLPSDLGDEAYIDAVSLVVNDHTPPGTSIKYYVAEDVESATDISGYQWKQVEPLTDSSNLSSQIIRFNGTRRTTKIIRTNKRNDDEIEMFPLNTTNVDPSKRNPTPSYFNQFDVYRIARLDDDLILSTLKLEEGINSTRIYYTDFDENAIAEGFSFWRDKFDSGDYDLAFGEIDTGHGFLYGADVGENYKSIYSETFLYVSEETPVILKQCRKSDLNSRTWDMKIYLNGREIASLPVGVDKLTVPWKFRQGKNHIVVMANIPENNDQNTAPYIGSFDIMSDAELYDYGDIKLDEWTYVDPYKFEVNLTNNAKSFTIYNNEIVTRKQPTNNFRVSFNQPEVESPSAIRLRVDMWRSESFSYLTPIVDSYRLRFSYTSPVETETAS